MTMNAAASNANAVSADGSVVVGYSSSAASGPFATEAFRWTQAGGIVGLGDLPGTRSTGEVEGAIYTGAPPPWDETLSE